MAFPSKRRHSHRQLLPRRVLIIAGYHVPAVRHRDAFYQKIEDERASALGQK